MFIRHLESTVYCYREIQTSSEIVSHMKSIYLMKNLQLVKRVVPCDLRLKCVWKEMDDMWKDVEFRN